MAPEGPEVACPKGPLACKFLWFVSFDAMNLTKDDLVGIF